MDIALPHTIDSICENIIYFYKYALYVCKRKKYFLYKKLCNQPLTSFLCIVFVV